VTTHSGPVSALILQWKMRSEVGSGSYVRNGTPSPLSNFLRKAQVGTVLGFQSLREAFVIVIL
jgi:hypothetical protein